jgi:hypothetical protein
MIRSTAVTAALIIGAGSAALAQQKPEASNMTLVG